MSVTCTYVHACTYAYMCMYKYVYMSINVCMFICTCTYPYDHLYMDICTFMCMCVYVYMCICVYACRCVCIYMYVGPYVHIYTHHSLLCFTVVVVSSYWCRFDFNHHPMIIVVSSFQLLVYNGIDIESQSIPPQGLTSEPVCKECKLCGQSYFPSSRLPAPTCMTAALKVESTPTTSTSTSPKTLLCGALGFQIHQQTDTT